MTDCTFCGKEIEPGTGKMYVKRNGDVYHYCASKCQHNMLGTGRVPRYIKWTKSFEKGQTRHG